MQQPGDGSLVAQLHSTPEICLAPLLLLLQLSTGPAVAPAWLFRTKLLKIAQLLREPIGAAATWAVVVSPLAAAAAAAAVLLARTMAARSASLVLTAAAIAGAALAPAAAFTAIAPTAARPVPLKR